MWDEAEGGRWSRPPAFPSAGGGLVSTVDDYHTYLYLRMRGGWGFGMAVRTYLGDYAPIGQFGWDGGTGTTAYADPHNQLTGILLTQVGLSTPDPARLIHDFWTAVYQAID